MPSPLRLSPYWLMKHRIDHETCGIIKCTKDVSAIMLHDVFGFSRIKVDCVVNDKTLFLMYGVQTWNHGQLRACSHYLHPITESEGETYVAMKLPFVDAD